MYISTPDLYTVGNFEFEFTNIEECEPIIISNATWDPGIPDSSETVSNIFEIPESN